MEGVDHVHIVQVGGGGLIGQVHRVLEGQVPNGEGFKLGVAGGDPTLVLVVELAEAGGHLTAARAGGGDHHQGTGGLHVLVLAKALVGDDLGNVVGVAGNGIVAVHPHAQALQPLLEQVGRLLAGILGDHHAAHIQVHAPEGVDQAQHIAVVGDAQVAPDLVLLNVGGIDDQNDLRLVLHLGQHADLAVRLKARQYPAGVEVVKQLAAKLQVQLAPELGNALLNVLGLHRKIFLVVKALSGHTFTSS